MRRNKNIQNKKGSVLLAVIIFSTIMAFSISSLILFGIQRRHETARLVIYNAELNSAEMALDRAVSLAFFVGSRQPRQYRAEPNSVELFLRDEYQTVNQFEGYVVDVVYDIPVDNLSTITPQMIADIGPEIAPWEGYSIFITTYTIAAGASATAGSGLAYTNSMARSGVYMAKNVSFFTVPLLNYAIFYDNVLELDGGARIDVRGKVHTNQDWYLTSSSSVAYHDAATVAGNFYGGIYNPLDGSRRGWWSGSDDIEITNQAPDTVGGDSSSFNDIGDETTNTYNQGFLSSVDYNVSNNRPAYDANTTPQDWWNPDPNWVDNSRRDFGRFLQDSSHGIERVNLPVGEGESPYLLIEGPENSIDSGTGLPSDNYDKKKVSLAYEASIIIEPRASNWIDNNSGLSIDERFRGYQLVPDANEATGYAEVEFDLEVLVDPNDPTQGTISFVDAVSLYNGREERYIDIIDIDMGLLAEYLESSTLTGNNGFNLTNSEIGVDGRTNDDGIIFVDNRQSNVPAGHQPGARMSNAANLKPIETHSGSQNFTGLTMATNAPLYTKGDVNKDENNQKMPLMLAGDSINVLSESFSDSNYSATGLSGNGPRNNASSTETNAVFVSGNVPTKVNQYGGGGENYFRYLERWSGQTHLFRGSMLNLFESRVAIISWDKNTGTGTSSGYYGAPRRNWGWDPEYAAGATPPGIPTARRMSLGRWELLNVAEFEAAGGNDLTFTPGGTVPTPRPSVTPSPTATP